MVLRFSNLKWLLFLASASAAVPVQAQDAKSAGQPISFSSPANSDAVPDVSLVPKSPDLSGLPDALLVPKSLNSDANSTPPSFVPRTVSPAQVDQLKTMLDDRKNWSLMTPEEILGVDTPEKILQIPRRDAAGQEQKLSAVDRYNQRRNQTQTPGVNGYDDNANNQDRRTDAGAINPVGSRLGNSSAGIWDQPVIAPENGILGGQNGDSSWSKLFGSSQQSSDPDPAQLAAMDRFKQLLQPSPSPATMTTPSSGDAASATPYYAPRDYRFGQSAANPSAASYTSLSSGIVTASGLKTPGAVQNNSQPAAPPAWVPKPAPWLSKMPQDFVVPKQKF
jgi:hypothetical protein